MKRKIYNENYFEKIDSPDKAYFLGLIYSDGNIINNPIIGRYQLNLKLHKKDNHILESFIQSIESESSVWENKKRPMSEIYFSGKKLIYDLNKLGLEPNKTFTIEYPILNIDLERHFLRGYFDGDGCIRIKTDKKDGNKRGDLRIVSGSLNILNKINERFSHIFSIKMNKIYGPENKNFKYIGWSAMTDIEKIYDGFYTDTNLFLKRKKDIFDEVLEICENKKKYRKK